VDAAPGPRVLAVCGMPFEAAIAQGPRVVTVCGPGPWRVAHRLHALLAMPTWPHADDGPRWAGIISFGCAGGLDPGLAGGSCVVATGVLAPDGIIAADPDWTRALLASLPGARSALLAGVDAPLTSAGAKARLWRDGGAAAADMESHAAALAARRHGIPFAACRVVLDPAWRGVPACALAAMDVAGAGAPWLALRGLAAAPTQLGAMCALARDAWVARRALRRARARLGAALGMPAA
jgi:hopanoid-associated phosphorylase